MSLQPVARRFVVAVQVTFTAPLSHTRPAFGRTFFTFSVTWNNDLAVPSHHYKPVVPNWTTTAIQAPLYNSTLARLTARATWCNGKPIWTHGPGQRSLRISVAKTGKRAVQAVLPPLP
jgi:hypothetical protein